MVDRRSSRRMAASRPKRCWRACRSFPARKSSTAASSLQEMDIDAILARHPAARAGGRTGPHQRAGQPPSQTLPGRARIARRRASTSTARSTSSTSKAAWTWCNKSPGVTVREAVPDSVLDQADEIELIDLTPEQLRKRLAEGKVYMGERAATASENFFREETLTALREMALRATDGARGPGVARRHARQAHPARRGSRASGWGWASGRVRFPGS